MQEVRRFAHFDCSNGSDACVLTDAGRLDSTRVGNESQSDRYRTGADGSAWRSRPHYNGDTCPAALVHDTVFNPCMSKML
jgi:hypothetical protein